MEEQVAGSGAVRGGYRHHRDEDIRPVRLRRSRSVPVTCKIRRNCKRTLASDRTLRSITIAHPAEDHEDHLHAGPQESVLWLRLNSPVPFAPGGRRTIVHKNNLISMGPCISFSSCSKDSVE